ncbi:PAS domain S-box protein [Thiomicrorhabdus sediminis]|uniref:PAS domain S-box protein n=1 Tax=Thiomicrorhabdus sediminis TaxID=2580412 RepID=A0A4P9K488_9GAMM|nr:PAS domain S-box protein [Thiomicrorhabdus sediminis]QCU89511.1 PAS domain S-box protein [Thiomicrorhabdus sediminis]
MFDWLERNKKKLCFITSVCFFIAPSFVKANAPILVFHSYHSEYPWTKEQMRGFTDEFNSQNELFPKYSVEELDSKRVELSESYEAIYQEYVKKKYANYQPKLIYATDDNALHFVIHDVRPLFPDVPVVFSGINDKATVSRLSDDYLTGVFEEKDIVANLELIQQLFPAENQVLVLGDDSNTARKTIESLQAQVAENDKLPKLKIQLNHYFDDALAGVDAFSGKVIVLTSIGAYKSSDGSLVPIKEVIDQLQANKALFIFSLEDSYIHGGVLGGYVNRGYLQGRFAAKTALQMTSLVKPEHTEAQVTNQWVFDSQALRDRQILLPERISQNAVYLNVEPSFFQRNEALAKVFLTVLSLLILFVSIVFIFYLVKSKKTMLANQNLLTQISKRLNLAQRITATGNWEWDISENKLWWSDQTYRLFGLQVGEMEPTPERFLSYVFSDDVEKLEKAIEESLNSKSDYKVVHRIVRKDGQIRVVEESGWLEFDENRMPIKMNGAVRDITEQHEAELKLQMQANIIDAVQDSVMVHDFAGHFIYLNKAAWQTRGYSQKEMMALSVADIDAPMEGYDFAENARKAIDSIRSQGAVRFQVEHLRKDGSHFPVEVFATLLKVDEQEYVLSSVRDVTERVKTQQALEASEKKYINLIENAMVGVYEASLSGAVLYVNSELAKMLGYESADALIGSSALSRYEDVSQRTFVVDSIKKNGSISNFQVNLLDKNGKVLPVLLSASLEGEVMSGTIINLCEILESRKKLEMFLQIMEQVDDSVIVTDKDGIINYVNPAFTRHTGYTSKEVLGKRPGAVKSGVHDHEFYSDLWECISSGEVFNAVFTNKHKDGHIFYEKKTITPLMDESEEIVGYVSTGKDVTQETLFNKELQDLASLDKLTGLFNRHKFEELYLLEEARAKRDYQALSLIIVDIDFFKRINDEFGHNAGDTVLVEVAQLLKNNTRSMDILARWGGEEFLILCPGTDLKNACSLAEKLRKEVEQHVFAEVNHITVSLGVSDYEANASFSAFFKKADDRLYLAKHHGRNQICFKDV